MDHSTEQSVGAAKIVAPCETSIAAPAADSRRDKHPFPGRKPFNMGTDMLHSSGHIRPHYMRQDQGICRIPLAGPNIEMVQCAGFDPNKHLLRTDYWFGEILIGKFVRSTMLAKNYSLHMPPESYEF